MNQLHTYPLGSIAVLDGYSQNAFQKEISYLLSLREERLLAGFYENAGIKTSFVRYGGWENSLIGGHTLGHYLTALAQGSVHANATEEQRVALLQKLKNTVKGLAECQAHSQGEEGFLWGALPVKEKGAEAQFDYVEKGKTNIVKEAWVPWYTMHKLIAGLIDGYRIGGVPQALEIAEKLGDWVFRRTSRWDKRLQNRVLCVEYGGMNDCLYELYALTGKEEYAIAAHRFDEESLFDKILTEGKDVLKDRHANTTIPKILGALNRYLTLHGKTVAGKKTDASRYLSVAKTFFSTVLERHTYVTGGNSEWEHFGADYVLDKERTNCNCETCNAYNMLKLARRLFCITGEKKYTDYYENTYINSILSSQNPETGMTTYFQPMASGYFKVYGQPYDKFWCCTGSGMESFTKLGDSFYFHDGERIYVEGYLASRLIDGNIVLVQKSDFPLSDKAVFRLERASKPVVLCFRIPDWAQKGISVKKNGEAVSVSEECGHICVDVREGDEIDLKIPCSLTCSRLPDGNAYAFRFGGAVLSADLGEEDMTTATTGVDVIVPARRVIKTERIYFSDLNAFLARPEEGFVREGDCFRFIAGDLPLSFGLHYRRFRERYGIYWYLCEGARVRENEETRTVCDVVQPGYGQYENDALHRMEEKDSVGVTSDGTYRYAKAGGYFRYYFAVEEGKENVLSVCLSGEDNGKTLKITAGDEILCEDVLLYTMGEAYYRREFPLSADLIARAGKVVSADGRMRKVLPVRFEGIKRKRSARVCDFIYVYSD